MSAGNVADGVAEAHDDSVEEGALVAVPDSVGDSSESRPDIGPSSILKDAKLDLQDARNREALETTKELQVADKSAAHSGKTLHDAAAAWSIVGSGSAGAGHAAGHDDELSAEPSSLLVVNWQKRPGSVDI